MSPSARQYSPYGFGGPAGTSVALATVAPCVGSPIAAGGIDSPRNALHRDHVSKPEALRGASANVLIVCARRRLARPHLISTAVTRMLVFSMPISRILL